MIEEILTGALYGFIIAFVACAALWVYIRFVQEGPRPR